MTSATLPTHNLHSAGTQSLPTSTHHCPSEREPLGVESASSCTTDTTQKSSGRYGQDTQLSRATPELSELPCDVDQSSLNGQDQSASWHKTVMSTPSEMRNRLTFNATNVMPWLRTKGAKSIAADQSFHCGRYIVFFFS
jgi:hypothetical protein